VASSLVSRAHRRASEVYLSRIRAHLSVGETKEALNDSLRYLQSEAAKNRKRSPARQALTDAQMAGYIALLALRLPAHRPQGGSALMRMPGPDALLKAFDDSLESAEGTRNDQ